MKKRYELRCALILASLSPGLLSAVSCAPSDLGSQVSTGNAAGLPVKAKFLKDTCIKVDENADCKTANERSACRVTSNTAVSIKGLIAPFGYSKGGASVGYFSASEITLLTNPTDSKPQSAPVAAVKPAAKSRLEQILDSVAKDDQNRGSETVPASNQRPTSVSSKLSLCTDEKLRELAASQGSAKNPLKIWSSEIEFENGYTPPVAHFSIIFPATGIVSSLFGWRWGRMHNGIDIANGVGTPIVAAQAGKLTNKEWNDGGYGNMILLTHEGEFQTRYAHMQSLKSRLGSQYIPGSEVAQGAILGPMGSTGRSTGPHLHFEVLKKSQGAVDPRQFLEPKYRNIGAQFTINRLESQVATDPTHSGTDADMPFEGE